MSSNEQLPLVTSFVVIPLLCLLVLITVCGNGLVCFFLLRDRQGKESLKTNNLAASLAVADIFMCVLVLPMSVMQELQVAFLPERSTTSSAGDARLGTPPAKNGDTCSGKNVPGEDDFTTVDRALEEALGEGVTGRQGLWGTTKKDHVGKDASQFSRSLPLLLFSHELFTNNPVRGRRTDKVQQL